MQFATLDMIVNRSLLEKGYPKHYYIEYLVHCSSAIRELTKDTLKAVKSADLPVHSDNTIDIPTDFTDDIAACLPVNGLLQPLPHNENINPVIKHDSSGDFVPFSNSNSTDETFFGFPTSYGWYWNINDYGESTGRYFGLSGGTSSGYKVNRERRKIQFTGTVSGGSIILLYISNGQSSDNATQVDWRAFQAIQSYCDWKSSPNAAIKDSPEAMTYYNERRRLVANLNPLTKNDILNIMRSAYTGAPKN
jgi:hypothetical protein